MSITLKIGARGSPLSLAQTRQVAEKLETANPGLKTEVVAIKTTGDKILDSPLAEIGGKGLFVKEIEQDLLDGKIDLAVHSAKDMPIELPKCLAIGCVPRRADPRDVLISRYPGGIDGLPKYAMLGTSGLRRQAQILAIRPDLVIGPMRGNVATRLEKLKTEFDATILAAAGLARLGISPDNAVILNPEEMLPAAGQGALVLEVRDKDEATRSIIAAINHHHTAMELAAERGFLSLLGSGCQLPVAALARLEGGSMTINGLIASLDGQRGLRGRHVREVETLDDAADLGRALAKDMLDSGGEAIVREVIDLADKSDDLAEAMGALEKL